MFTLCRPASILGFGQNSDMTYTKLNVIGWHLAEISKAIRCAWPARAWGPMFKDDEHIIIGCTLERKFTKLNLTNGST